MLTYICQFFWTFNNSKGNLSIFIYNIKGSRGGGREKGWMRTCWVGWLSRLTCVVWPVCWPRDQEEEAPGIKDRRIKEKDGHRTQRSNPAALRKRPGGRVLLSICEDRWAKTAFLILYHYYCCCCCYCCYNISYYYCSCWNYNFNCNRCFYITNECGACIGKVPKRIACMGECN